MGFWTTGVAMMIMGLTFGVAGVLQSYIERVLGMGYMTAQAQMQFWFKIAIGSGVVFLIGVLVMVFDLLTMKPAPAEVASE